MAQEQGFQSFALEISHHVRKKTLGVTGERAENVVLTLPRDAVARLASASDPEEQNLVLRQAVVLLDGQPVNLWGSESTESAAAQSPADPPPTPAAKPTTAAAPAIPQALPAATAPAQVARDTAPDVLKSLQDKYQVTLDRIVRDLDSQARFVGYAPPVFITFHKGVYLQLSLTAPVPADADTSRYRSAAVAFDEHIASLVRPIMAYFKEDADFDGINFSTTIRPTGLAADAGSSLAVEYIFSVAALRSYELFDSTGQQLINSGFVLINGERVGLDLQAAESRSSR
jgi:hypothetical protein